MFEINIYTILLWVTGILIASFDLVVFFGSRKLSSRIFTIFSSIVAIWSISYGFLLASTSSDIPFVLIKIDHMFGMVITLGFVYFSLIYPDDRKPQRRVPFILSLMGLIFLILFFFSNQMITGMYEVHGPDHWGWKTGNLYFLYGLLFNLLWVIILANIYRKAKKLEFKTQRKNQLFMFWGLTLGIIPPALLNIILPTFGIYGISWLGPIVSAIWIYIIGYSIIRYRQMDVKAVAAEVLAIAMSIILFINIFVDISSDPWSGVITFIAFIVLAYYLIKNILREAKQAEQLKDLNDNLERKVAEQTTEIRKSYDLEKKARRELEKLNETKDQFIMITQHHLRTPVTGLRWELESILSGAQGRLSPAVRESLSEAQTSVARLTRIVDDFLSITALKAGSNILNLSQTNLKPILSDILHELRLDIENKRLTVNLPAESQEWPVLNIDSSKVREALLIIIENAVRYNNDGGSINIEAIKDQKWFTITVTDTGVGVKAEDKEKIFNNLFHRGEKARQLNPIGMGVGLSVARAIIRAHHGELELVSEGEGRGTKVVIRMPVG